MNNKEIIYLDHAATTPVSLDVFARIEPYYIDQFGNASSIHESGYIVKKALAEARKQVSDILGCGPNEIIFTGSGTESNNLALKGVAEAHNYKGHIITSAIEHHSVLETVHYLEKRGLRATIVDVDNTGIVNPNNVEKAIREDTFLVSIMCANNEIGSIQPISETGKLVQKKGILMHTDAVQAPGLLSLNINKLHVDLLSLSAHKFYGPKGVGLLYANKGVTLSPQLHGGGQERGARSSTENVPGIVGMASALVGANECKEKEVERLSKLRNWLIKEIRKNIPNAVLTGHPINRLANNVSFSFPNVSGEQLVMRLSEQGFLTSSGSACTTGSVEPSHVLLACGLDANISRGSLRITLGNSTTKDSLVQFLRVLQVELEKLH
jgi:cysteine desulfurase